MDGDSSESPYAELGRMLRCAVAAYKSGVGFNSCWYKYKDQPLDPSWVAVATFLARGSVLNLDEQIALAQQRAQFVDDQRKKLLDEVEQEAVALRELRRQELAAELKTARLRLAQLNNQINTQTAFVRLFASSLLDRAPEYPPTPPPTVTATDTGEGLPQSSGIYFVWSRDLIVYVGQSVNIAQRARSRGHDAINPGDSLSWLPFEQEALNWAESFYIGIHRPVRNFGGASHLARAATSSETES